MALLRLAGLVWVLGMGVGVVREVGAVDATLHRSGSLEDALVHGAAAGSLYPLLLVLHATRGVNRVTVTVDVAQPPRVRLE